MRAPDILMIVLDCVSQEETLQNGRPVADLPFLRSLAADGITFDHAVSPSTWTLPTHVSLFTGQFPWEHGVFRKGLPRLPPSAEPLADRLRRVGYRTASFSANPFLSVDFGLTLGFESAYWGSFADCTLRKLSSRLDLSSSLPSSVAGNEHSNLIKAVRRWWRQLDDAAQLFPLGPDAVLRVLSMVLDGPSTAPSRVSPWIEHRLSEWLSRLSRDVPAFCFINLLDAHEPYFGLPESLSSITRWIRIMSVPQGRRFLGELDHPAARKEVQQLRELYRHGLKILDRRIGEIVALLRKFRDMDSTCIVVTSDHGQSFGSDGVLFHGSGGGPDSIHRVPLIIKPVNGLGGGTTVHNWMSTQNVTRTIIENLSVLGVSGFADGIRWPDALSSTRPVMSLAEAGDAILPDIVPANLRLPNKREAAAIVTYWRGLKVITDLRTGQSKTFSADGATSPEEIGPDVDPEASELIRRETVPVVELIRRARASAPNWDTLAKLRSWGYD